MDVSRVFPLSPAFSDCDSLAGIDDLDAFLDAQGKFVAMAYTAVENGFGGGTRGVQRGQRL
jgi:hypothetical protein